MASVTLRCYHIPSSINNTNNNNKSFIKVDKSRPIIRFKSIINPNRRSLGVCSSASDDGVGAGAGTVPSGDNIP
ncbi:hypothetical protein Tco_1241629, partial [Tanacetum coccineum]